MTRTHTPTLVAAGLLFVLAARAVPAWSQEPAPAPAPPNPAPSAPAVDSNMLYVGDWDFTAELRDSTVEGAWRINYANGRFTGVVALASITPHSGASVRPGLPPSPISSMSVRDHYRNFTLTAYFNNESYVFSGHLDNPRTVTGTLSIRGGIGRLRALKRA